MKWLKMWILLSLLTLFLAVGCNGETATEPAATAPVNDQPTASDLATAQPIPAPTTAVPLPTSEITRTIRLTPAVTPEFEIVATIEPPAVFGEVPEAIMAAVYENLINTENVSKEAIEVTKAEAVIWRDGSLGCPQPGEVYTQATVPGYWIVLKVDGRAYNYHATENGTFFLCSNSQPLSPPIVGTPIS